MKNILIFLVVASCSLGSQLLLKKGMMAAGPLTGIIPALRVALTSPAVYCGIILQGCGLCLWLFILTRTNLGFALGFVGAFFYLLLPLLTWWLYGETLTPVQWLGMVFICLGVLCLGTKL